MDDTIRRRRACGLLVLGVVVAALSFGFGHSGVHAVRSLLVPGAGLYDERNLVLGVTLTVAAIAATYGWLRWGMDWLVVSVVATSMVLSAAFAYEDHPVDRLAAHAAAHEFPLVVIVAASLSWVRVIFRRSPVGRARAARAEPRLAPIDQCRAATLNSMTLNDATLNDATLNDATGALQPLDVAALVRRCRRVGIVARARFTGDPTRTDHAHVRAALALHGLLDDAALDLFRSDASRSLVGVPASEPGWVRLLDGTLAAIALQRAGDPHVGERWSATLHGPLELRRGHRPGALWTPIAIRGPRSATWEHAAATGLARAEGWLQTDDDWHALRTRTLAAAARGNVVADDERLVAAARIWLRFVDDEQASRIVGRVTIERDPIAVSLDAVATSLEPTRRH